MGTLRLIAGGSHAQYYQKLTRIPTRLKPLFYVQLPSLHIHKHKQIRHTLVPTYLPT